jgi:hypothetical protein
MLTTAELRRVWGPGPFPAPQLRKVIYDNRNFSVHPQTEAAWNALFAVMARHDYSIDDGVLDDWSYAPRPITGGTELSLHAFGIACDFNATSNPYGAKLVTNMSTAMIADISAIRTSNGKQVFRWGGSYSGKRDAMHFEVVVTPGDLETGLLELEPAPLPEDLMDYEYIDKKFAELRQEVYNAIDNKLFRGARPAEDDPSVNLYRIQEAVRTEEGKTAYNAAQHAADQADKILKKV